MIKRNVSLWLQSCQSKHIFVVVGKEKECQECIHHES